MKKDWEISTEENVFKIHFDGKSVSVNGEVTKLNKLPKEMFFFGLDKAIYTIQIGKEEAFLHLYSSIVPFLVYNNIDCETKEEFTNPIMPLWSKVLMALQLGNLINGALGGAACVLGIGFTRAVVLDKKKSTNTKILLSVLALIGAYVAVFAVAILLNSLL